MATYEDMMAQEYAMAVTSGNADAINAVSGVYNAPDFGAAAASYFGAVTPAAATGGGSPPVQEYEAPPEAFSALQIMENAIQEAMGITGMGEWAADLYNRGASINEIVRALRYGTDTSEAGQRVYQSYLQAFPKMDKFLKEGYFTGSNPEMQYKEYRNTAREAAQRYGIDDSLVGNDKIANYIENRVSTSELVDRMNTASAAVATTTPELLQTMQEYYGVKQGDLISYYLDPETTEATLKARYTAAQVGTEALRQDFGINRTEAEQFAAQGLSADEANKAFSTANAQKAFMSGAGETASREDILKNVSGQAEAAKKLQRIASTRVGRFEQGGKFLQDQGGASGLGTANTM